MPRQKKNSSEKHTGKFFVPGARNSRCPPPAKPTNKPVSLGDKSDEEIIDNTSYEFSIEIEKLLNNSTTTRRSQANPNKPPRPQNAFMLYRRDKFAKYTKENEGTNLKQSKFSQEISPMWINESPEVKELFNALSRVSEKIHMETHGENYRYLPRQKRQNGRKKNYDTSSSSHSYSDTDIGSPNSINIPDSPASDTSYTSSEFYNQDNMIANNCVIDFSSFGNNNINNILSYANYNVIPPVTPVTLPVTPVLHVPDYFNGQEFSRIFLAYNLYMDLKSKNSMNDDFDDQEFSRIFSTAYHMHMAKNSMNEVVSDTPPEFSEELFNEYVNF